MKQRLILGSLLLGLAIFLFLLTFPSGEANALPEYSAETGEPCATCHVSPSGGGSRTARGQAWIADKKPGAVPDLLKSLRLLGVNMDFDPDDYSNPKGIVPADEPLPVVVDKVKNIHDHLASFPGN